MRDKFPLGLFIFFGMLGLAYGFMPHPIPQAVHDYLRNSLMRIVGAFALVLGIGNLVLHHWYRIKRKSTNWRHSYTMLISMAVVTVISLFGGPTGQGPLPTKLLGFPFDSTTIYNKLIIPLGATMFALLAFYMASASYRAFRAKNAMAVLLLGSAFIVMLGQVPVGQMISPWIPKAGAWLMQVPNTASKRGINLGVTLGATAMLLKMLTGVERSWMGGGR